MQAEVSTSGLTLHSQVKGKAEALQITPLAIGKDTLSDITKGNVSLAGNTIALRRNGISEIFSSSVDGIRQDFLIHHKPAGSKPLTLALAVQGATVTGSGQQLSLHTEAGRHLVYNKLHITDADGLVLSGQMLAVNASTLHITVEDSQARYPLLIDPTYSDANWQSLNSGIPGVNGSVNATAEFDGKLYVAGNFTLAGTVMANRIAAWDGTEWSVLGSGLNAQVNALKVFNKQLIAGGEFTQAGDKVSPYLAALNSAYATAVFNSQGGSAVADITVEIDDWVTLPPAPTRSGYTFKEWDTEPDGSGVPYNSDFRIPAAGITLYAQWTVPQYTVTFNSNGGTAIAPVSLDFGSAVAAPAVPVREGYSFTGWNPALPTTMPAENLTVTAQWTANQYSLTFDSNGGSAIAPISLDFGRSITAPAVPVREGYTFTGWSPVLPATMPAANLMVTAQWAVNQYSITFNSNGGSAIAPVSLVFGSPIAAPTTPVREGYTFAGWSPALPATMPAANLTVTAQWIADASVPQPLYNITFGSNGGSAIALLSLIAGAVINAPADPVRTGYTFTGWNPALPVTMPAANLIVTAQWMANPYSITFDSNGGSAMAPINLTTGSAITAPANPVREGYTFTGWNPALPATMPATNLTVTAQWAVIPENTRNPRYIAGSTGSVLLSLLAMLVLWRRGRGIS